MAPILFAGYPAPFLRETPENSGTRVQQLLWGDFVFDLGEEAGDWVKVRGRNEEGWIRREALQTERLLEVNFVDIGQGDGTFIVTPDDEFLLIDAGVGDNMRRFLSWRFNLRAHPDAAVPIKAAVITHSDQDHYGGFRELFASPRFEFGTVFHNGIVERAGEDLLGPFVAVNGQRYLTDLIDDLPSLLARLADDAFVGTKQYPRMLKAASGTGRVGGIQALEATHGFLPGYEAEHDLSIEVLAPVRETVGGVAALRVLGSDGVTKNGHSIVLRLAYRDVKILLGGDLNVPSEHYLLGHYAGFDPGLGEEEAPETVITSARAVFEADVAKSCHHGSADFTELFLQVVNPVATVVSSGDDEPHAHPRPDTLGAIGKYGRGTRPLIFSTELSRSAREVITNPADTFKRLQRLFIALEDAETDSERRAIRRQIEPLLERSIAVYGMINLRTDGRKVLLAYKLERPGTGRREFDVHLLEPGETGRMEYVRTL